MLTTAPQTLRFDSDPNEVFCPNVAGVGVEPTLVRIMRPLRTPILYPALLNYYFQKVLGEESNTEIFDALPLSYLGMEPRAGIEPTPPSWHEK